MYGQFGWWTGLAPDDSILELRDTSVEEIYALGVKFPQRIPPFALAAPGQPLRFSLSQPNLAS